MFRRATFLSGACALLFAFVCSSHGASSNFVRNKTERLRAYESETQAYSQWIMENFADSVRRRDEIGFEAGRSGIFFPWTLSRLFFKSGIDPNDPTSYELATVIDSLVKDGVVLPFADTADLEGTIVDSTLLHLLYDYQADYLGRCISNATPEDTFSIYTESGTTFSDLSSYWLAGFPDSFSVDLIKADLAALSICQDAFYIGILQSTDVRPPEEHIADCQYENELSIQQYYLFGPDSSLGTIRIDTAGIDAYGAWDLLCDRWSEADNVLIGVSDDGFGSDPDFHPDIRGSISPLSRVDFGNYHGNHGTRVAGVCGAMMTNGPVSSISKPSTAGSPENKGIIGKGIIGVSPRTQMVLTDWRDGTDYLADIKYLIDSTDVDVINLSWKLRRINYPPLERLLEKAFFTKGIALVASGGNCDIDDCGAWLPAILPYVIAVAGTDSTINQESGFPERWKKSVISPFIDVAAPAGGIFTTGSNGKFPDSILENYGYGYSDGTSFSAPLATAAAALLKIARPGLAAATVYDILTETCDSVHGSIYYPNDSVGYGKINAKQAVAKALELSCSGVAGDVNVDCYVNMGDVTMLFNYMYGSITDLPEPNNADVNSDCALDISDLLYLTDFVLGSGEAPQPGCVESSSVAQTGNRIKHTKPVLHDTYPNPFNPSTTISYDLPKSAHISLTIYNLLGQTVRNVFTGEQAAGQYALVWDGKDDNAVPVATGVYFYRLETEAFSASKKLILLK